jgi:hypothetical protein
MTNSNKNIYYKIDLSEKYINLIIDILKSKKQEVVEQLNEYVQSYSVNGQVQTVALFKEYSNLEMYFTDILLGRAGTKEKTKSEMNSKKCEEQQHQDKFTAKTHSV